jgi:hypothetical protein
MISLPRILSHLRWIHPQKPLKPGVDGQRSTLCWVVSSGAGSAGLEGRRTERREAEAEASALVLGKEGGGMDIVTEVGVGS